MPAGQLIGLLRSQQRRIKSNTLKLDEVDQGQKISFLGQIAYRILTPMHFIHWPIFLIMHDIHYIYGQEVQLSQKYRATLRSII